MKKNTISQSFEDFNKLSPEFTGERYTIGSGIRISYEHFNRYCFALSNIEQGSIVLDLGCGTGYGSILLAQKAKAVYAVDIDQVSLDLLSAVCKKHKISNVYPVCCDINQIEDCLGLPAGQINAVVCHELIEHINQADQLALLNKISSAAGPFSKDCQLFISTPEKEIYNSINVAHNQFHLQELEEKEFKNLLSSSFKNSKFFWQMPVAGDLILSTEGETNLKSEVINYINWNNGFNRVGHPEPKMPFGKKGVYMYAISSNTKIPLSLKSSLLIDVENREIIERFAIAADELRKLNQLVKTPPQVKEPLAVVQRVNISSEEKLQIASAKKIKSLIFEVEKIAAQKVKIEQELERLRPMLDNIGQDMLDRILETPLLVGEAIAYYDLRRRFAHRLANYILFKLQRRKSYIAASKLFKFVRLVMSS